MDKRWNYSFSVFYKDGNIEDSPIRNHKVKVYNFQNLPSLIAELNELIIHNYNNLENEGPYGLFHMQLAEGDNTLFQIYASKDNLIPDGIGLFLSFENSISEQKIMDEGRIDLKPILDFIAEKKAYRIGFLNLETFQLVPQLASLLDDYSYKKLGFKVLVGVETMDNSTNGPSFSRYFQIDSFYHYRTLFNAISHIVSLPVHGMDLQAVHTNNAFNRAIVLDSYNQKLISIDFNFDKRDSWNTNLILNIHNDIYLWGGKEINTTRFKPEDFDSACQLQMATIDPEKWIYQVTDLYVGFLKDNIEMVNGDIYNSKEFAIRFEIKERDSEELSGGFCRLFDSMGEMTKFLFSLNLGKIFSPGTLGDKNTIVSQIVAYSSTSGAPLIVIEKSWSESNAREAKFFITVDKDGLAREYCDERFKDITKPSIKDGKAIYEIYYALRIIRNRDSGKGGPTDFSI